MTEPWKVKSNRIAAGWTLLPPDDDDAIEMAADEVAERMAAVLSGSAS